MYKELNIKWVKWIDWANLTENETQDIFRKFDFHELDEEACLEGNQKARIDCYDDYIFAILHFPKYNLKKRIYELNEFNIFMGRNFLITLRDHEWRHIDEIFAKYSNSEIEKNGDIKISSGFMLYEIIQAMLEKMFRVSANVGKDIKTIENKVFDETSSSLVKDIMIKKRNIVVLKHMFKPQISVLKMLEDRVNQLFKWKMEVYFEDLEDKLEQIVNEIVILEEHIDSVEDAFKTIVDINTNMIVKVLTIFSAFLLPLTLITSFYWMNISLPYQEKSYFVYAIFILTFIFMWAMFFLLRRKGKI